MKLIAYRIGVGIAACGLSFAAGMPTAHADPVTLPPMTSTNSGPVIGGGGAAPQMSQQLKSLSDPNVQEVDGSDAAQFIGGRSRCHEPRPRLPLHGVAASVELSAEQRGVRSARLPAQRRAVGRRDAGHRQKHVPEHRRDEILRDVQLAKAFGGQHHVNVQQRLDLSPADLQQARRRLCRLARRHELRLLQCAQRELQEQRRSAWP